MDDGEESIYPPPRDSFSGDSNGNSFIAKPRRTILVVSGMHRSGTSLCAHILSAMGIDMADEISANKSNPRGHWERWEIVEFHDRILGLFNRDYFGPFHDLPLPVAWWADPRVAAIKREIVAFLEKRMDRGYFGFKDPRTVRLMPVWHQIFKELDLTPKIVLCLRNPAQVARSLRARDGLDLDLGEYRWLTHMVDFFRYSGGFDVCMVEYERWFAEPLANFEELKTFVGVQWQQTDSDLELVLSGVIDPALRHDSPDHKEANCPMVRSLYELGSDRAGARMPSGRIDIVSQFFAFQRLQEPFQRAFESAVELAAKFPRLEQEVAALRSAVGERDAETEGLRARLDEITRERDVRSAALQEEQSRLAESEAALKAALGRGDEFAAFVKSTEAERSASLAALEAQQSCVAALTSERDALRAAAAEFQSEIKTLRGVLADAEQRELEHHAMVSALQENNKTLRGVLADAEQRELEHHAMVSALQENNKTLRGVLADAERRGLEHYAEVSALQGSNKSLSLMLEDAERARQEGQTVAAACQGEIASLRTELDAARGVGRAALASIRIPALTLPPGPAAGS